MHARKTHPKLLPHSVSHPKNPPMTHVRRRRNRKRGVNRATLTTAAPTVGKTTTTAAVTPGSKVKVKVNNEGEDDKLMDNSNSSNCQKVALTLKCDSNDANGQAIELVDKQVVSASTSPPPNVQSATRGSVSSNCNSNSEGNNNKSGILGRSLKKLNRLNSPPASKASLNGGVRMTVAAANEARRRVESNLAAIMMGYVLVFLVCHFPRIMLSILELQHFR